MTKPALFFLTAALSIFSTGAHATPSELVAAAMARTEHMVVYNSSYRRIPYPGGDVSSQFGVCTDVIIRSYRALGIDLQVLVHEDLKSSFAAYPDHWGLTRPDSNIDHRRVPNLRRFFERQQALVAITSTAEDYLPGDLVTWNLNPKGQLPHIGIVTDQLAPSGNPMIVHNIGRGPELEDMLFDYEITGHYRYFPELS